MTIKSLRKEVENHLNLVDEFGSQIRKHRNVINKLKDKPSVNAKEYQTLTNATKDIAALEKQRREVTKLNGMLDPEAAKLMRLSKTFDTISEQYDSGDMTPSVYEESLQKLLARLTPVPANTDDDPGFVDMRVFGAPTRGGDMWDAMTHIFATFVVVVVLIPLLFSCSFQ